MSGAIWLLRLASVLELSPSPQVEVIKTFALANFKENRVLNFALAVEDVTTAKKANLILNVDGCIACCFVTAANSGAYSASSKVFKVFDQRTFNALKDILGAAQDDFTCVQDSLFTGPKPQSEVCLCVPRRFRVLQCFEFP